MKIWNRFLISIWALLLQSPFLFAQFQQTSGPEGGVINAMINHCGTLLAGSQGSGIFRSTDGGNTWALSNTGLQSLIVFTFAEKDSVILAGTPAGLYKSTDDGVSWISDGLSVDVVSVLICGNYKFAGSTYFGIYRSDLDVNNWTRKNTGLTNLDIASITSFDSLIYIGTENGIFMSDVWGNHWTAAGFYPIAISLAVSDSMVFAGTIGGGIFKSPVGSTTWTYSGYGMVGNEIVQAIKVNSGVLYAGCESGNVYRSDNSGNTWTPHNNGLSGQNVKSLEYLGAMPLAGTVGGGVFLFNESGDSWEPMNSGLINTSVGTLLTLGSEVLCGTEDTGIFATSNDGASWISRSSGLPPVPVNTLLQSGQNLFCGLSGYGVYKSVDQGQTWFHSGLDQVIFSLTELPGKLLAGSNNGVYGSADNGKTWEPSGNGLPSNNRVTSLLPAGTDVFAGLYNSGVYISTDQGSNWTARNDGIADLRVFCMEKNDSSLFVGTQYGIYRSMDNGLQWTAVFEGLTSMSIYSLTNTANGMLAGTFNGLFLSQNNGNSWVNVGDDLTDASIHAIAVSGNTVFAGTSHNGVWSNQLSVISGAKETANPTRILVYPNPAQDYFVVKIKLDKVTGFGLINLYDGNGKVVLSKTFSGKQDQVVFPASNLKTGLYLIVLEVEGNHLDSAKIEILN